MQSPDGYQAKRNRIRLENGIAIYLIATQAYIQRARGTFYA
jgi:hypothetical protein